MKAAQKKLIASIEEALQVVTYKLAAYQTADEAGVVVDHEAWEALIRSRQYLEDSLHDAHAPRRKVDSCTAALISANID